MRVLRRSWRIALVAVVLTLSLQAQLLETEPAIPSGPYRIAGTAVDAKTGNPLAYARVQIMNAKRQQETQAYATSGDGRFEFHVLAGKYGLFAAKRGYIQSAYNQHELFSSGIVTGAGLDTENLILRVMPAAVLSGRVLDENGEPVRGAAVMVHRQNHESGITRVDSVRGATTDDQGSYEAPSLEPGTYFVSVTTSPWYEVHPATAIVGSSSSSSADSSLDVAYPTTYYGDVTEAEEATPIPVRGGDRLEADIHLTPVAALHLLFSVPDEGRNGVNVPSIEKPAFGQMETVPNDGVQQVSPGVYEITGVPAGSYVVRMPGSDGQLQSPMAVNLASSQELSGVGGSPTGSATITVQMMGSAVLPNGLYLGLRDNKGSVNTEAVGAQGKVEFGDLMGGQYTVVAGVPNAIYSVVRLSVGGQAVEGRSFSVAPGAAVEASVTLITGSATVQGLAKRNGKPAPGAMIVLVPKDPENNQDLFRRDQSDLDGTFSLLNVVPGTYSVIAIEDGWDLDWAKPVVLVRYNRHGQPLTVPPGSRGTIQLPRPVDVEPK